MKNFVRIMLLPIVLCCWSCSGGGEDVPTPTPTPTPKPEEKPKIEVTTTAPVLAQEGGTSTVTFTSTDSWTIDVTEGRAVSWCSVTPTSGSKGTNTLTIKATANDTYDERNAKVTIKAGTTTQSFVVTQKQKDGLTVTSNKVEVGAEGGDIAIEVKANVKYEYEIDEASQSWIAGGSRALTSSTIKLKVAENENTSKREGKIIIRSGELSETVTVYQEGSKPTIVLTQNEYTVASEGETIKVEMKSNVNYEIQLPSVNWIKESSSRSMSVATHYFEVASNEGYDARSAEILFVNKENGLSEKVTINQMQKDAIIVAKNEYTVDAAGGDLKFEVNTNVDFKVETSVDWVKQNTESRGLEAKPLSFKIAENTADEAREGVITISSGDLKQEIKVVQKAKSTFSVSQTEFNVASAGGKFGLNVSTNGEYTVTLPKVDWLNEITTRATAIYNHVFLISANDTYDVREAEIVFTHKETGEVLKVKVIQAQKDAIIVAENEYTVEAAGGDLKFEVNTNVDFKVETSVDWMKQNTESRGLEAKPLCFTIAENTADEAREGVITISSGDLKQEIKVVQKAKTSFSVSETEFSVGSGGGEISFIVTSNVEYDVNWTSVDWLKNISKDNGKYVFTVAANGGYDARNVVITVLNKATQEKTSVKVFQAQKDAIIVAENEYTVEAIGGDLKFEVNSNVDFKVETSAYWIKQNMESRGLESKTLSFAIVENFSGDSREGTITLSSGEVKQVIKIVQKAKPVFSISETVFNESFTGGNFRVEVLTNGEYTITLPEVDWLQEITSRAPSIHTHWFQVDRNETYEGREAEILFTHTETGEVLKVKVIQQQKNFIAVEKDEYEVPSFGDTITVDVKTNTEFEISIRDNWIIHTETRSLSKKTLTFVILKNESKDKRSSYIWLNAPSCGASIHIKQDSGVDTNGNINGMPEENWD